MTIKAHKIHFLIMTFCLSALRATGATGETPPLIGGPGVSQETLEAIAEGHGRTLLSDHYDLRRPHENDSAKLTRLVERAQSAWLSGTMEIARGLFKEIAGLALEADWREPQREAIHYSMLRLAQSAATATERSDWMERAVTVFPDLHPDTDSFPPPLIESFNKTRARLQGLAQIFKPADHFPEHRYLLLNGKKFVITPDLKIRLPKGLFRVTLLSDFHGALTEKLTSSQLHVFRLSSSMLAAGTCPEPEGADVPAELDSFTVVFSMDCLRTRTRQGWSPRDSEKPTPLPSIDQYLEAKKPTAMTRSKKAWLWTGFAALVAGAAYLTYREVDRKPGEWIFGEF